ncbi:hypothetical protein OUZ56_020223 [Daphnia magna]|uniref:Uncharacterized protein n=1 Tax=Daphnia magna TaxID=35525 RepID=A0ABQ9ZDW4_9CRUS|nr:hypothetical protein OUZ56_020223 [Daphnia magna]
MKDRPPNMVEGPFIKYITRLSMKNWNSPFIHVLVDYSSWFNQQVSSINPPEKGRTPLGFKNKDWVPLLNATCQFQAQIHWAKRRKESILKTIV